MSTFDLLHEKVQRFIYAQKWTEFRPIQDAAIVSLITTKDNLLICAPTASGKTEAAFLPIVSKIADAFSGSYRAIYVSPLKALINDQFKRIDLMCEHIGIPVTRWHGDVSQSSKKNSLDNPSGILLITPESLEAMLINNSQHVRKAFSMLKFVVIDEVHSFIGSERGAQLKSLIKRIQREAKCDPTVVALSATVGNPQDVTKWIDKNKNCAVVTDNEWADDSGIEGIIRGFTSLMPTDDRVSILNQTLIEALYLNFLEGKNLIFGNSKKKLEETAYSVVQIAKRRNRDNQFQIHHGSLSKYMRELAENNLKTETKPISVFCTSTLEMGLDIGAIEKIGLIDPPWSVASFAQRLGRSGRRSGTFKKFEFLINHFEVSPEINMSEKLREDLVKSIAIVLLYLNGFKEPLDVGKAHYSTLVHQILSHCIQSQGTTEGKIKNLVTDSFVFNEDEITPLLKYLCENQILYKDSANLYMAGKEGEKFSSTYEFYSVFLSSEQWSVVHDGQLIGQIPVLGVYREGDNLLLGGRVWTVISSSDSNKKLIVKPATNALAPIFSASFGITHAAIHQKMLEVYSSTTTYPFLDVVAKRLLTEARLSYDEMLRESSLTKTTYPIFEGTKVQNTIAAILDLCGIEFGMSEICLELETADVSWIGKFQSCLEKFESAFSLAKVISRKNKIQQKYDAFLPDNMLSESYASSSLDVDGTRIWIAKLAFAS